MSWHFEPLAAGFTRMRSSWDALNRELNREHPLLDGRFVGPLVEHYAEPDDLLAVEEAAGSVRSMLALSPRRRGVWSIFLPAQTQLGPALISGDTDFNALFRQLPGVTLVLELLCQDPLYSPFDELPTSSRMSSLAHSLTVNIALDGSFEDYWQARSRNLRKNLRRTRKRATDEELAAELTVHETQPALREALQRYAQMESQGWKAAEGTAIDTTTRQGRFYGDVVQAFGAVGRAAIYELYNGQRLTASQIVIFSEPMMVTLKITHDETMRHLSPGRVLDYMLLERAYAERRHEVVEFYTNASPEQTTWGTGTRTISHVTLYRHPLIKTLLKARRQASVRQSDAD